MQPDHDRITQLCAETMGFLRGQLIAMAQAGATPPMLQQFVNGMGSVQMANVDDASGVMLTGGQMLHSTELQALYPPPIPEEVAVVFKEMEAMLGIPRSHFPMCASEKSEESEPELEANSRKVRMLGFTRPTDSAGEVSESIQDI